MYNLYIVHLKFCGWYEAERRNDIIMRICDRCATEKHKLNLTVG